MHFLLQKESKVASRTQKFLIVSTFFKDFHCQESKWRSVSVRIHYGIRDLWMDQLLESVGMLVIDRADADVTCHSSRALSLALSRYDQYVMLRPWGSLAHFMLYHVAESKLFRLWVLIAWAHICKGYRDRKLTSFGTYSSDFTSAINTERKTD